MSVIERDTAMSGLALTSGQRAIWFDQLLHGDQPLYNMSGCLRILGPINRERFEAACHELIRRNDALRLVLRVAGDVPTQEILAHYVPPLRYLDLSSSPEKRAQAQDWMTSEIDKAPRMLDAPLFDFALIKIADDEFWWFHTYHHLILDAYGHSLLTSRLAAIYSGLADDQPAPSYVEYIRYDQEAQASERWAADLRYWAERFAALPEPMLERKVFGERIEHRRHVVTLPRTFYNRVSAFAAESGASTFHVILAALYACFTVTEGREDFVIGLPTLNRSSAAFKATAGLFTNVTPSWFRLGTDVSSLELLRGIAAELRRDYRHQRIPLSEINRLAGVYRDGRPQMFDIVLSYQKHSYDVSFAGHPVEQISLRHGLKTPLMLEVSEYNDDLDVQINVDYSVSAFDEAGVERFGERLKTVLELLLTSGKTKIRDLPIPSAANGTRHVEASPSAEASEAPEELDAPARSDFSSAELEARLTAIWKEALGREHVGLHDNVFDLGGHSLLLIRVAHRIAGEIGCALTITQMFMYPTIHALAGALCAEEHARPGVDAARERGAARRRLAAARASGTQA